MRPSKYRSNNTQKPLTSCNPGLNYRETNTLFKSVTLESNPPVELHNLGTSLYDKKQSIENLAENIEEDVNNTRRISCLIKMKSFNMIPSIVMRDSREVKEAAIRKLADEVRKCANETDSMKRFSDMERVFTKVILLDDKFAHILKVIKTVYEERIRSIVGVFPQYNKRINDLSTELNKLKKLCEESKISWKTENTNSRIKGKYNTSNVDMSKTMSLSTVIEGYRGQLFKKSKGTVIPRLDLTKVRGNFPNEKIPFVPAKQKPCLYDSISDDEEETLYKEISKNIDCDKNRNIAFNYSTCSHGNKTFL
eukprot:TRINITY_DN2418_c0_g2_i1.p1 TRINITY_DN2418_c0_g2~~TRINITY_DN2418_c0_g2_i1.p1  ORF type:complete len:308 (-),score=69.52 TRINITY_DN2418_c0_g2_i1:132-1055(-)